MKNPAAAVSRGRRLAARLRAGGASPTGRRRFLPQNPHIMNGRCYYCLEDLDPMRGCWDHWAGDCVFRSWTWLATWWAHYGVPPGRPERQLTIYTAEDADGQVVAALPCYQVHSLVHGRTLRLLGDGEVCSDHLGLLAGPARRDEAIEAIAEVLAADPTWDLIDLDGVDDDDEATASLLAALAERGCDVSREPSHRCWSIALPEDWETFLALQSKSHRKQLRQLQRRVLEGGRAHWHLVRSAAEFDETWRRLVELHQRRRQSLGQPGCFSWPRWAGFHCDVARRLLDEGRLRLSWLELDRAAAAAGYHLAGTRTTVAYQGGVDPGRLDEEPGRLSMIRAMQHALEEGHATFDLLRGDEAYKAHWRAVPHTTARWLAAAPRALPRWRRRAWSSARRWGRAARQWTGQSGSQQIHARTRP
ncbi:MAG TPA: GNAT family N-acetyltransferase [Lacipirellulaceae bacterium]|nr:GNAT family N-acetyltransferase [Lacipirellulaceae bacterium]